MDRRPTLSSYRRHRPYTVVEGEALEDEVPVGEVPEPGVAWTVMDETGDAIGEIVEIEPFDAGEPTSFSELAKSMEDTYFVRNSSLRVSRTSLMFAPLRATAYPTLGQAADAIWWRCFPFKSIGWRLMRFLVMISDWSYVLAKTSLKGAFAIALLAVLATGFGDSWELMAQGKSAVHRSLVEWMGPWQEPGSP